jgi:Leucine Rich repeats (2 copies)
MTDTNKQLPKPKPQDIAKCRAWWNGLTFKWQKAFDEGMFKNNDAPPTDDQLWSLWNQPVVRLAGPTALFPNISFELDDLSGIKDLVNIEILVVVNQNISTIKEISGLKNLKSLFLFSNRLISVEGVETLTNLTEFYLNDNKITSLQPLSGLVNLTKIYCAKNKLENFDGIGTQHKALTNFHCLPNDGVWNSEIMKFENETRIRCMKE